MIDMPWKQYNTEQFKAFKMSQEMITALDTFTLESVELYATQLAEGESIEVTDFKLLCGNAAAAIDQKTGVTIETPNGTN
jgi:hypothetical protein